MALSTTTKRNKNVFDKCLVIIVPVTETSKPVYKMYENTDDNIQHDLHHRNASFLTRLQNLSNIAKQLKVFQ